MKGFTPTALSLLLLGWQEPARAQDQAAPPAATATPPETGDAAPPTPSVASASDRQVYTPADFARFAPSNALDMLNQVPGFDIVSQNQGRGLGQAGGNVLINGERVASKSDSLFDVVSRIATNRVERIEIVDGATLGIPGLSGQVAIVYTRPGPISGRFEYRTVFRPKYAEPSFFAGEVSLSGSTPRLEWTVAATHGSGRGAAAGPGTIHDAAGMLIETRQVHEKFVGEFPRLAGTLKWDGPGTMTANFNALYTRTYDDFDNDEARDLVAGIDLFRDFHSRTRGWGYEIGGDVEFALGPGRLRLIGLERANHSENTSDSVSAFADASPSSGSRFAQESDTGERIGRAEYAWDMLGGGWQLDAEAAFNRLDRVAELFTLDPVGGFVAAGFTGGTGGVTEDRYEAILNHNRTLAGGLTMQLGLGGEYSQLEQAGANGLVRSFWRPKGSLTLAWTPETGLDLSFKLARTVGQLSFGDFLAGVDLAGNTARAGNAQLVPQQAWEADLEVRKNLGAWGSATVRGYARLIDDFIELVPIGGGLEARGNIDGARRLGLEANATINLDPVGWQGAQVTAELGIEDGRLDDPLTGLRRPFSGIRDRRGEISLRYDVPRSDWAFGAGFEWVHVQPAVRLTETSTAYEGPIYSFGFIEHKDVLGLTVNLNVFNLTDGRGIFHRTVHTGPRDASPIAFVERRNLSIQPIFRLSVKGDF